MHFTLPFTESVPDLYITNNNKRATEEPQNHLFQHVYYCVLSHFFINILTNAARIRQKIIARPHHA